VPLRAVMAWRNPRAPGVAGTRPPIPAGATGDERALEAEESLREFVINALGSVADVDCSVVHGNEVDALLSAANDAELLVVGEPRPGRLSSMRASLVAPQVVFKAGCPVVVIPAAASTRG
jgi:nucleotide-binding universal stress UspA family protein